MSFINSKFIGIVGSGKYNNNKFVIKFLDYNIDTDNTIIVSGHSPRNPYIDENGKKKYNNVDIWVEDWANEFCSKEPLIYPAKSFDWNGFSSRNLLIANRIDFFVGFINKGQYKSGMWNTFRYFLEKHKNDDFNNFIIFDENGNKWKN